MTSSVHIAALVLPDTFMASLAPLTDAFALMRERGERMIGGDKGPAPDVRISLLSPDGRDIALGDHGMLRINRAIALGDRFDFIWIPAFRAYGEESLRQRLSANRAVIDWLKEAAEAGSVIGASGAAVTLPMAAGLADRLPIPVAAPLLPVVRALFPRFRHGLDMAMADYPGLILSCGIGQDVQAITAAFSRLFSPETGRWVRSVFGCETARDEIPAQGAIRDPLAASARLMLEQRFSASVSMADLAAELCVSHGVLIRRFRREFGMTPLAYVQHLRLGAAQRLLRHSDRTIDSIALAVGYNDARLFREMFRKATGQSASAWRAQHAAIGSHES